MISRRHFFGSAGAALATATAATSVSRAALAALPEPVTQSAADTMAPLAPASGPPARRNA